MANYLDLAIAELFPGWAVKREQARQILSYYEAAKPSKQRKGRREHGSGDTATLRAGSSLREQARHLEQNHDLVRGAIGILIANIVGPNGITVEPQPRRQDRSIDTDFAAQILDLYNDWSARPEVTWEHDWPSAQRLSCRTWIRDGEFLAQLLSGPMDTLQHGTEVPFSIELLEADYLPFEHNSFENPVITQGVERNAWGKPIAYHVFRAHPGDMYRLPLQLYDLKRISADRIIHPKLVDRFSQARGVTALASVLMRLDDIKDYEESERIAAKVAASMAAVIKKGTPDMYVAGDGEDSRDIRFRAGSILTGLLPGESIETIDSNRPNPNLVTYRDGQLKAVSSGIGVNASSLSKNYNGSYSSQRQELVEGWSNYLTIQNEFTARFVRPIYEQFITTAVLSGKLRIPSHIQPRSVLRAIYQGPQMPWIDPQREAKAWETLERNGHASGPEIIRRRGFTPEDVFEQERAWRQRWRDARELIATDPAIDPKYQALLGVTNEQNANQG